MCLHWFSITLWCSRMIVMVWCCQLDLFIGLRCFFWSSLVQGAISCSLVLKSRGLCGGLCWSGGIVACTLKGFCWALVLWPVQVESFLGPVMCWWCSDLSYGGLHWCGWVVMLVWRALLCCVYGGVQWSRALVRGFSDTLPFKVLSATTSGLCLTSQMKFPFMKLVMFRLCGSAFILVGCWTRADRAVRRSEGERV